MRRFARQTRALQDEPLNYDNSDRTRTYGNFKIYSSTPRTKSSWTSILKRIQYITYCMSHTVCVKVTLRTYSHWLSIELRFWIELLNGVTVTESYCSEFKLERPRNWSTKMLRFEIVVSPEVVVPLITGFAGSSPPMGLLILL